LRLPVLRQAEVAVEVGCHDGLEFGQQAGLQSCHAGYATVTYGAVARGVVTGPRRIGSIQVWAENPEGFKSFRRCSDHPRMLWLLLTPSRPENVTAGNERD
jgi:hypothetical protein